MYHSQKSLNENRDQRWFFRRLAEDNVREEYRKMFMGDSRIQSSQVMNYISDLKAPAALPRIFNGLTLVLHVYDFFFIKMTLTNKF